MLIEIKDFLAKAENKIAELTKELLQQYLHDVPSPCLADKIELLATIVDIVQSARPEETDTLQEFVEFALDYFELIDVPIGAYNHVQPSVLTQPISPVPGTGNGDGGEFIFVEEDITVTTQKVGGYIKGDLLEAGTKSTDFLKKLLQELYYPTFIAPSVTFDTTPKIAKIGSVRRVPLTFTFNRGSILGKTQGATWDVNGFQNYRAGKVTEYKFIKASNGEDATNLTGFYEVENYTIKQGYNRFSGVMQYANGSQPVDSSGANYGTPLEGDTVALSVTVEGVYPLFATTELINVLAEQVLVSMITGNNVEFLLVAEGGGNKQAFDIPNAWLANRPLSTVVFFNTFSSKWDEDNKLSTFATSSVSHAVSGVDTPYTRFTNTAPDRGAMRIKLIF